MSRSRQDPAADEVAAQRAQARLLGDASHDLRQPMQAMALMLDVLVDRIEAGPGRDLVLDLRRAHAALASLLNAHLDLARLNGGLIEPRQRDFVVADLLHGLAASHASWAGDAGIAMRCVPSGATVHSDPDLVERILDHILVNAIQHARARRIVLGCRRAPSGLRIEIRDDGIGIPDSARPATLGSPEGPGAGRGLEIVRRLAALLDHPAALSAPASGGTVFALVLPLAVQSRPATADARPGPPAPDQRPLIALLEDDPEVRDVMARILETAGFHVHRAGSGDELLRQVAEARLRPALVIADNRLPGRSGIETIRRLRGLIDAPVPGIIVSGDVSPALRQEAEAAGCEIYRKPVAPGRLRARVRRLLAARPAC